MAQAITVLLKDNLNDLHNLIAAIETFRDMHALSQAVFYNIHLVCEEIFVNFINYGTTKSKNKQMSITIDLDDSLLTIISKDNGVPMNPLNAPMPNIGAELDDRTTGGLGIFLIRHWADKLDYCFKDACNILTAQKKISIIHDKR
jgi:anti-sigma regulatory factor (Ser/Thr protein kinase)